jgi:hypothetical protein
VLRLTHVPFAEANVTSSPTDPVACIFSTFLIIFSRVVSTGLSPPVIRRAPPTLAQVLDSLNIGRPVVMGDDGALTDGVVSSSDIDMTLSSTVLGDIELSECVATTVDGGVTDGSTTTATPPGSNATSDEKSGSPARRQSQVVRAESYGVNLRSSFSMPAQAQVPFSQFGDNKDPSFSADFLDINNDVREEYLMIARAAIEVRINLLY